MADVHVPHLFDRQPHRDRKPSSDFDGGAAGRPAMPPQPRSRPLGQFLRNATVAQTMDLAGDPDRI
jgi:hypothetical protein